MSLVFSYKTHSLLTEPGTVHWNSFPTERVQRSGNQEEEFENQGEGVRK